MAFRPPPLRTVTADPEKDPDGFSERVILPINQLFLWIGNIVKNGLSFADNTQSVIVPMSLPLGDTSAYPIRIRWPYSVPPAGLLIANCRLHSKPASGFTGSPFPVWTYTAGYISVSGLGATFSAATLYDITFWAFA